MNSNCRFADEAVLGLFIFTHAAWSRIRGDFLCVWVIAPIYFLLISTLSAPESVNNLLKSFIPEFDFGSLQSFAGFAGILTMSKNSVIVALLTMVMSIIITASAILAFLISWNEVFAAAVLTIENRTLTAFLLHNLYTSPLRLKFAGGFILVVPALFFIVAVRKYLFAMWGIAHR